MEKMEKWFSFLFIAMPLLVVLGFNTLAGVVIGVQLLSMLVYGPKLHVIRNKMQEKAVSLMLLLFFSATLLHALGFHELASTTAKAGSISFLLFLVITLITSTLIKDQ